MRFAAVALALPILASATAIDVLPRQSNQCTTGTMYCCNSIQNVNSPLVGLLAPPQLDLGPITGQVGVMCSPLSGIGVAGNSCTAQPACCTGANYGGLIIVGCSPITLTP